jgi:hypothetical protein
MPFSITTIFMLNQTTLIKKSSFQFIPQIEIHCQCQSANFYFLLPRAFAVYQPKVFFRLDDEAPKPAPEPPGPRGGRGRGPPPEPKRSESPEYVETIFTTR